MFVKFPKRTAWKSLTSTFLFYCAKIQNYNISLYVFSRFRNFKTPYCRAIKIDRVMCKNEKKPSSQKEVCCEGIYWLPAILNGI
jgi:hypothetical protein